MSVVDRDRIWFKSHHGLDVEETGRDSVTVRVVDDEVRIHYRGELLRDHRRRHPKEKEEVIWSHHRRQSNRTLP